MSNVEDFWSEPFKIYRSSAGSGKTYRLTVEYLKLALRWEGYHKHILAVTFTNKATKELKERVLESLYRASKGDVNHLLEEVRKDLEVSESEFQRRSHVMLQSLLHEFNGFHICTIDTFFQRIIRAFTREEGIRGNYQLELDTEFALAEAVDRTFNMVGSDKDISKWLTQFMLYKIGEGQAWDIRNSLIKDGKELLTDNFREMQLSSNFKSDKNLDAIFNEIQSYRETILSEVKRIGKQANAKLNEFSLDPSMLYQTSSGIGGLFERWSKGIFHEFKVHSSKSVIEDHWYTKSSNNAEDIDRCLDGGLRKIAREAFEFHEKNYKIFRTIEMVISGFYNIAVSGTILNNLKEYLLDEGKILLSDSPVFLQSIIGDSETPFIYEKTGSWFKHYLIDEFQDTSRLQWANFLPLIKETLDTQTISMIVGDVKQSIYRWRGSDWELLNRQVYSDIGESQVRKEQLDKNFRSTRNIIAFNNDFFTNCTRIYFNNNNKEHHDTLEEQVNSVYEDSKQKSNDFYVNEGYVKVERIDSDDSYNESTIKATVERVAELQRRGIPPGDIAILVRQNKYIDGLANAFIAAERENTDPLVSYHVVSDELMNLYNSGIVNFIINILKYLNDENDDIVLANILSDYYLYYQPEPSIFEPHKVNKSQWIDALPGEFAELGKSRYFLSVQGLVDKIINIFSLDRYPGEIPFLLGLQDEIIEYFDSGPGDIHSFLNWWDSPGKKRISSIESSNAIRIMTIHKAKGLQFGAVVIPWCDWPIVDSRNKILIKPEVEPFKDLDYILLGASSSLENTIFANAYYEEMKKSIVDNFNLLYVAFTRAIHELHIFIPVPPPDNSEKKKKINEINNVGNLVLTYFTEKHPSFEWGEPKKLIIEKKDSQEIFNFHNYNKAGWSDKVRVSQSEIVKLDKTISKSINTGVLVHNLLSEIKSSDEKDVVLDKYLRSANLNSDQEGELRQTLTGIFKNQTVRKWFDMPNYRETSIIGEQGEILRPDKIVNAGNEIYIIDFKTGDEKDTYKKQVGKYMQTVESLIGKRVRGFILYTNPLKIVSI